MIDKICIIGVGLIGGSFAAGLKQANQVQTIVGFGRHEDSLIKLGYCHCITRCRYGINRHTCG